MKNILIVLFLLISIKSLSQEIPIIDFLSPNLISGEAEIGTQVMIDLNNSDNNIDYIAEVDNQGAFSYQFPKPLILESVVYVFTKKGQNQSEKAVALVRSESKILLDNTNLGKEKRLNNIQLIESDMINLKNKTLTYKVTIMNTNFSIPLARFNFTSDDDTKKGDLILFNSIGAGFGFSSGSLTRTRNEHGEIINEEFTNTIGAHFGFLFSAGTGEDSKNVFAPTLNLSVLDFQLGIGYELGTISTNQKRTFLTLSYAIPLYKLTKTGYWIWLDDETPVNNTKLGGQGGN